jgi:glycosyltransferase involved in cell wall biosynthesis
MTFNHESYIKEAMDGIMSQKTSFPIEVVIGDDFSNDSTLEILKSYKSSENVHIKILNRLEDNLYKQKRADLGRLYNFIDIMRNCSGKYIALLDGDDYWNDPEKIAKQVQILEANENCEIVYTNHINYNNSTGESTLPKSFSLDVSYELLLSKNPIATSSAMIRSQSYEKYVAALKEEKICSWKMGDRPLWMYLSLKGRILRIDDFTTVYRRVKPGGTLNFFDRKKTFYFVLSSLAMRYYFIFKIKFSVKGLVAVSRQFFGLVTGYGVYLIRGFFNRTNQV